MHERNLDKCEYMPSSSLQLYIYILRTRRLLVLPEHIDENIIQKSGHSNEKDPRDWRQPYRK